MNYEIELFEGETPFELGEIMRNFFANNPGVIVQKMTQSSVIYLGKHITTIVILYTEA